MWVCWLEFHWIVEEQANQGYLSEKLAATAATTSFSAVMFIIRIFSNFSHIEVTFKLNY